MHPHSILVCDIDVVRSLSVRLTVRPSTLNGEEWFWKYFLPTGEIIASGNSPTRLAAQVAAQRAYESWLYRNRRLINTRSSASYSWREDGSQTL